MRGAELAQFIAFIAVAEERSFRRAAARLNLTPSTLSHSVRSLEERLGTRLLNRTTRTVSPTEAGRALLLQLQPAFESIDSAVESLNEFRSHPAGHIRLSLPMMAATMGFVPVLQAFSASYPDITLELSANDRFVDIVEQGYDAGVRLGGSIDGDMVAVRVTPDLQVAVVASPQYLEEHGTPGNPKDVQGHRCICYRQPESGMLCRWEFKRKARALSVSVSGPLVFDSHDLMVTGALQGIGLGYLIESSIHDHLESGRLVKVLEDWSPSLPGFYLYYPAGRSVSGALRALIDTVKLQEPKKEI